MAVDDIFIHFLVDIVKTFAPACFILPLEFEGGKFRLFLLPRKSVPKSVSARESVLTVFLYCTVNIFNAFQIFFFSSNFRRKKYTNLIYLYYTGDLKKSIAGMEFDDDTSEMTEDMLFDRHYKILKKLHHDGLIIIDNFNVLSKDDSFFREFEQNDFQLLITTRCRPTQYLIMELKQLDTDTELPELFYRLCPSAKKDALATKQIIQTVHSHTLTVVLSALSLSANGMEAEELLYELQTCGMSISFGEAVELYKDGNYTEGLMAEHLKKLLQLEKLDETAIHYLTVCIASALCMDWK